MKKWSFIICLLLIVAGSLFLYLYGNPYHHYQTKEAMMERFYNDSAERLNSIVVKTHYDRSATSYPYYAEAYVTYHQNHGAFYYYVFEDNELYMSTAQREPFTTIEEVTFYHD